MIFPLLSTRYSAFSGACVVVGRCGGGCSYDLGDDNISSRCCWRDLGLGKPADNGTPRLEEFPSIEGTITSLSATEDLLVDGS